MSSGERKLDQFLSIIVLALYVVVITINWIMLYQDVPENAIRAVQIIKTVIQCLVICVVLYNALGWTDNWILKIVFIVLALYLVVSTVAVWLPQVQEQFTKWNIYLLN